MPIEFPHPRTVSQLYGHAEAEQMLADQFRAGTLHHSLLITGAKGIGKATLAYRFARFILSGGAELHEAETHSFALFAPEPASEPEEGSGALFMPESHGIFKRVAGGSHSDLLTVEPAFDAKKGVYKSEIQAEVAREMGGFLALTPAESNHRVVVIDAADQLNEKAANALLKNVEEPPGNAFIIIVCHNPLSILPTIRSRCRVVKLATPDLSAFASVLRERAPHITMDEYDLLRELSFGSPGFAMLLAAQHASMLYRTALDALCVRTPLAGLQGVASELAAGKSPESWMVGQHVLLQVVERALLVSGGGKASVFEGEQPMLEALHARLGTAGLLALRDKARQLFSTTDSLNLDKQAAMLSVLKAA